MDANLVLNWLIPSQQSPVADAARLELAAEGYELVAPPLLYVEVTSILRNQVHFRKMTPEDGETAFRRFCSLGIASINHPELHMQAWSLVRELSMPKAYDAQYLALAEILACNVWTMDERLINAVGGRFRRIRAIV
jgi:predicted nucleic acid-binding protein